MLYRIRFARQKFEDTQQIIQGLIDTDIRDTPFGDFLERALVRRYGDEVDSDFLDRYFENLGIAGECLKGFSLHLLTQLFNAGGLLGIFVNLANKPLIVLGLRKVYDRKHPRKIDDSDLWVPVQHPLGDFGVSTAIYCIFRPYTNIPNSDDNGNPHTYLRAGLSMLPTGALWVYPSGLVRRENSEILSIIIDQLFFEKPWENLGLYQRITGEYRE